MATYCHLYCHHNIINKKTPKRNRARGSFRTASSAAHIHEHEWKETLHHAITLYHTVSNVKTDRLDALGVTTAHKLVQLLAHGALALSHAVVAMAKE